jgi:hypothetical protein
MTRSGRKLPRTSCASDRRDESAGQLQEATTGQRVHGGPGSVVVEPRQTRGRTPTDLPMGHLICRAPMPASVTSCGSIVLPLCPGHLQADKCAEFEGSVVTPSDRRRAGQLIDGRLSFDALQRRLVTAPGKARQLITSTPASYAAFDLLALAGSRPAHATLDQPAPAPRVAGRLVPAAAAVHGHRRPRRGAGFEVLAAMGVSGGLVAKGKASRYEPGRRGWPTVSSVGVGAVRTVS